MEIAVIGAGSMGMAFVRCWLSKEILVKENIYLIESSEQRIKDVKSEISLQIENQLSAISDCQFVFLAVKPQDFETVAKELANHLKPDQVIVSIMAGVKISKISKLLNSHTAIIRVMPNLPILVAAGISAYYAASSIDHVIINIFEQILS